MSTISYKHNPEIENASGSDIMPLKSAVTRSQPITQERFEKDNDLESKFFGINILFWAVCFMISTGVIYVIVQNGDKIFKHPAVRTINKTMELSPSDTAYIDSLTSQKSSVGGRMYYTGGYDINLYSE
jgi:hypothetical protein